MREGGVGEGRKSEMLSGRAVDLTFGKGIDMKNEGGGQHKQN